VRTLLIKVLLWLLNTEYLNQSPCSYAFVGNVDNFSREDIEGTLKADPEMSLREYLTRADRFKSCPLSRAGVTVIESDGTYTQNVEWRP